MLLFIERRRFKCYLIYIGVFMGRVISTITENRNRTEPKKLNRICNRTELVKTEPNRTKYSVIGSDMGLAMKTENRKYIKIYFFYVFIYKNNH